jgi:hypothetical protein
MKNLKPTYQLSVKKTVNETVEITLPYYFKTEYTAYFIMSENRAVKVGFNSYLKEIGHTFPESAFATNEIKTEITKEEFTEIFNKAVESLKINNGI